MVQKLQVNSSAHLQLLKIHFRKMIHDIKEKIDDKGDRSHKIRWMALLKRVFDRCDRLDRLSTEGANSPYSQNDCL